MACRFAALVIVASWVLATPQLRAQPGPAPPGYGQPMYDAGAPEAVYGMHGGPHGHPGVHGPALPCGCPECAGGLGGWGPGAYSPWVPRHGQGGATISQQMPYGFDDHLEISPFEAWFKRVARNMWVRLEYLNWEIQKPGSQLIGEGPPRGDPLRPFDLFEEVVDPADPDGPPLLVPIGQARALGLGRVGYRDTNGMRLTLGIPYQTFDYEWTAWLLEQASDRAIANVPSGSPLLGTAQFGWLPTRIDGQRSDALVLLFDQHFQARAHAEAWGTDMKWIFKRSPQWPGLRVDPLVEARFLQVRENMHVVGVFTGRGTLTPPFAPPFTTIIDSDSYNHIYGGGVGISARFVHPLVTLGFEPRGSLALNTFRNRVEAENVLFTGDSQRTIDKGTTFCPTAEIQAYIKATPTPHCTIVGGYNLLVLSRIARPYRGLRYDLLTDGNGNFVDSDVSVDSDFRSLIIHGWSVGAEFTF